MTVSSSAANDGLREASCDGQATATALRSIRAPAHPVARRRHRMPVRGAFFSTEAMKDPAIVAEGRILAVVYDLHPLQ